MKQRTVPSLLQLDQILRSLCYRILDTVDALVEHARPEQSKEPDIQLQSGLHDDAYKLNELEKSQFLKEWRDAGRI